MGNSIGACAVWAAQTESHLDVRLTDLLYVYSRPKRDLHHITLPTVLLAPAENLPVAGEVAKSADVQGP